MTAEKVTVIGPHRYTASHMSPRDARRIMLRAGKLLGPALAFATVANGSEAAVTAERVVAAFFDAATDADLDLVIDTFAANCSVEVNFLFVAKPPVLPLSTVFDTVFGGGQIGKQIAWLTWIFQWEFADFLSDLSSGAMLASLGLPAKAAKDSSPSRTA